MQRSFSDSMILINLHFESYELKSYLMTKSNNKRKNKSVFYFMTVAAVAVLAFVFIIKEGQRIKMENELLSYEVW